MRGASHSRPRPIAFKSWYELWVAPYGGAYGANWVGVSGWVCLGGCVKLCLGGCVKLVWVDQALFLVLKPKTKSDTVPPCTPAWDARKGNPIGPPLSHPRESGLHLTLYPRLGRPQGQPDRAAAFPPSGKRPPPDTVPPPGTPAGATRSGRRFPTLGKAASTSSRRYRSNRQYRRR